MRVLHVLDQSLPCVAGYTSRARSILESQAALGLEPIAVTGLRQGPCEHDREALYGILHHRTVAPRLLHQSRLGTAPLVREAIEMGALGSRILDIHEELPVDIVHAHSPVLCGVPAYAAAHRIGVPFVYEIRAFWEDAAESQRRDHRGSPRYAAIRKLETSLCRGADSVVALCEGIRADLRDRGVPEEKVFVVPNGVDTDRFMPREANPAIAERLGFQGKTVIAYIGTLFRFEGVDLLLKALAQITAENDQIRGLIVGYGETEAELRALHAELGLGDRVVLTGKADPASVGEYYALADVLCYPRARQRITELTTPLKPLEAMSMAKAVVCSDVGGLRELVEDDYTALLFKADDEGDLVRVLTQLAADPDRRRALGDRARTTMVMERSWRSIVKRYAPVYEAAFESARRAAARLPLAA